MGYFGNFSEQTEVNISRIIKVNYSKNFHFLSVYPGPIETEQARSNSPLDSKSKRMHPDILAEKILSAYLKKKKYLYPGIITKLMILISFIAPSFLEKIMVYVIFKKVSKR